MTHLIYHGVVVQGFDENMMAMLKQQYPSRLMPQLVQSSQATLQVPPPLLDKPCAA